jgi:hypothetical protein
VEEDQGSFGEGEISEWSLDLLRTDDLRIRKPISSSSGYQTQPWVRSSAFRRRSG